MLTRDEKFMQTALSLAKKGLGRTSPNPMVGAVIVRAGRIIAQGYHKKAGAPHAEVEAIRAMPGKIGKQDTLYVTLEPCNHQGRTPPCTQAILQANIKKVVVAMLDPNPHVTGHGIRFLKARGVDVKFGVLEAQSRNLNEIYIKHITTGRPFIIAKSAMTLDGWIAVQSGDSQWVTNVESRKFVHGLRNQVDAVMVGINTVLTDDPALTVRLDRVKTRDPLRIILDTHLRISEKAKVLVQPSRSKTLLVIGPQVRDKRVRAFSALNAEVIRCPGKGDYLDLGALMDMLGKRSIASVLLEGGATLMGAMIREQLIDKFYLFKAAKLLGGNDGIPMSVGPGPLKMNQALALKDVNITRFADDILVTAYPDWPFYK